MQQARQILQRRRERQAAQCHLVGDRQHRRAVALRERVEQSDQIALVERAEHAAHRVFADLIRRIGNRLIGQRQRVAHGPVGRAREQAQRLRLVRHALFAEDAFEMRHDMAGRHLLQIELQTARQHGDRNLLRVGRREDELDVRRRLFERLQHRVERVVRQHVHFVDHVDLEARIDGRVHRALEQRGHFIDAAIARRVHLDVIDKAPFVDLAARTAHAARRRRHAGLAIERLREDARQRSLADAAGTRKQIRMVQTAAVERMGERAHHVLLSDERSEILRPPFACENLIGHPEIVSVTMPRKTDSGRRTRAPRGHADAASKRGERSMRKLGMTVGKLQRNRENGREERTTKEGDEPDPRHWWKTAVAASFPT